ncbi:MAG: iron ABC transporter permease [Armatimonadota bacterium]|nr:iron ABC transporter permease [Armatimonadota bacterium]
MAVFSPALVVCLHRLRFGLARPHVIIGLALGVLLALLVVAPMLQLVVTTLTWSDEDLRAHPDAEPGAPTAFHWRRVFSSEISRNVLYVPLANSLVTALGASAVALAVGGLLAWLVVRTDVLGRTWLQTLGVVPYVLPSWTIALVWLILFRSPRAGAGVGLVESATGAPPPDWLAYGPLPIVVVLGLHYFPFAFLLLAAAMRSLDASLEESGEVLGARGGTILRRITVPLLLPALLSAFILTFSKALGTFGTPYLLGLPVRYFTLSTMIYAHIVSRAAAGGYILALVLIVISALTVHANQRAIGARRSFVTITGRGMRTRIRPLGPWRAPAAAFAWGVIAIAVVVPLGLLLWNSLMRYPDDYSLRNLTAHFWIGRSDPAIADGEAGILRNRPILGAAFNSLRLSVATAVLTGVAGLAVGLAVVRGRGTLLAKMVEQVSFLPYLVPSIAFGAVYLAVFLRSWGPLPALYGTFALLVLTCTVKNLPFASRSGIAALMQVSGELEEASAVLGAGLWLRVRRILVPLVASGLLSGVLLAFISTMRELSLIILLITPATRTLTTMTFRYTEQGLPQFANAIIVLLIALILVGELLARRLEARAATAPRERGDRL